MPVSYRRMATTLLLLCLAASSSAQEPLSPPPPPPADAAGAATPPPSSGETEWRSMSRARVTAPLPAQAPMSADLLPLPPPPGPPAPQPAAPAIAAAAPAAHAAPSAAAPAAPGALYAPLAPGQRPAPAAAEGQLAAGDPAALESPGAAGGPPEPTAKMAADQTGVMVSMTQKLESDRIRRGWAERGGSIGAFEASGGMSLMYLYKDPMTMSGVGLNFGAKVANLTLTAPDYERRDQSWTATKIGVGADLGALSVTITTPVVCYPYAGCVGGTETASMSTFTLSGLFGYMQAFGSFDSPTDWSGWAIGLDWAPSYQTTTLTLPDGSVQSDSQFNLTGFAINFESGSMKSMAMKMGKQAHMKLSFFFLPPVSEDVPFIMNVTVGAVWY